MYAPLLCGQGTGRCFADADLVVVGARSGSGLARLLIGSVSSEVVQHSACPVVIVPHER
ncbi:MAG TPA: universal stress protein [Streptosporangiaceae bacterium]